MFDRFDHWYDSTLFGEKIKKVARNLSTFIPFAFIYRVYMGSIETQIYRVSYTSTCDQGFFRCSNVGTRGKGLWKLVRRPRYDYFRQALRIAWQWPKDSLHCLVAWVTCKSRPDKLSTNATGYTPAPFLLSFVWVYVVADITNYEKVIS